jgi:hypothetical protein
MPKPVPILLLSDSPDGVSGLGRITRDLASLLCTMPQFRVGTLGLGGTGSRHLPWSQYTLGRHADGSYEYGELSLARVWDDFAGSEPGVLFTINDLSRLLWLARPEYMADESMRAWVQAARADRMQLWSYIPLDSTGPNGKLTTQFAATLLGIDRILVTSPWAEQVVTATIGSEESVKRGLDWLPHGLNMQVFKPAAEPLPAEETPLIGIVMTNQARKDWGSAAAICAGIKEQLAGKVRFWWHVDRQVRHWDLTALAADFGLTEQIELTLPPVTDQWLAGQYQRCALTLHLGLGEGFGYPIFESLACGKRIRCVDYASTTSILRTCYPTLGQTLAATRLDTTYNCVRPVIYVDEWVENVLDMLEEPWEPDVVAATVAHLDWQKLGPRFKHWFRDGLV